MSLFTAIGASSSVLPSSAGLKYFNSSPMSDRNVGRKFTREIRSWHSTGHLDKKGSKKFQKETRKLDNYTKPCFNGFMKGIKAVKTTGQAALTVIKPKKRLRYLLSPIYKKKEPKPKRSESKPFEFMKKVTHDANHFFASGFELASTEREPLFGGPSGSGYGQSFIDGFCGTLGLARRHAMSDGEEEDYESSDSEPDLPYFFEQLFGSIGKK